MEQPLRLAEDEDDDDECTCSNNNRVVINEYNNTIILYDYIDDDIAAEITENYQRFAESVDDITIKINSCGGSLYAVHSILSDIMQLIKGGKNVVAVINGAAMSGAGMIALAASYTKMSRFGTIMLHNPLWGGGEGSIQEQKADLETTQESFEFVMRELLKDKKLTYAAFKKLTDNKNLYLSPKECLRYGLIDEII